MKTVRILAGMMMYELVDFMIENGVQIPALPTIMNAQIAGAVSTGSHVSVPYRLVGNIWMYFAM